jgi:hypothetical protein
MSHHGPRAVVGPSIPLLVPRIDAFESVIDTALLDVESSDHAAVP